jgi:ECF transporter S component (folate family)
MKKPQKYKLVYRITATAVFIALAAVIKLFVSIPIPIFGANGMKVGLSGIFTAFPAFIFGPVYGGIASAASDIIGYLMRPDGAYIPWLTITLFAGGCVKGLIWRLISSRREVRFRAAAAILCAVIAAFGAASHVSLNNDGVMNGFIAVKENLPTRGKIEATAMSALSKVSVELAKYNKDTITFASFNDSEAEECAVPSAVLIDGYKTAVTKIAADAFKNAPNVKRIVTSLGASAFDGVETNGAEIVTVESNPDADINSAEFTFQSSDTYRKYLAGYINFTTVGIEAAAAAIVIYLITDILYSKFSKRKGGAASGNFIKVLLSVVISGVIVTTIDTQILRIFLPAWTDRAFLILWIPRVIEEIIVCSIQAYIITILYDIYLRRLRRGVS